MMNFVLMADIQGSSEKSGKELMFGFKKIVEKANSNFSNEILSPLTITLGDEFQGVMRSLKGSLETIFFLEEEIVKSNSIFDLRYVLNYGAIETDLNPERSYEMLGPGLSHARQLLEEIKGDHRKILVNGLGEKKDRELNLVFELYQTLKETWPQKDIREIGKFIELKDYKQVAKAMGKDVSSAWRKEKTLRIKDYFRIKELIISLAA